LEDEDVEEARCATCPAQEEEVWADSLAAFPMNDSIVLAKRLDSSTVTV